MKMPVHWKVKDSPSYSQKTYWPCQLCSLCACRQNRQVLPPRPHTAGKLLVSIIWAQLCQPQFVAWRVEERVENQRESCSFLIPEWRQHCSNQWKEPGVKYLTVKSWLCIYYVILRTVDFWGSETTLYDTVMVDTCHYILAKIHKVYSTQSEPWCKLWTLVVKKTVVSLYDMQRLPGQLSEKSNTEQYI